MNAPEYTASDSPLWKAVDVLGRINSDQNSYSLPSQLITDMRHALQAVGYFERQYPEMFRKEDR